MTALANQCLQAPQGANIPSCGFDRRTGESAEESMEPLLRSEDPPQPSEVAKQAHLGVEVALGQLERGANVSHLIPEAPMFGHRAAVHPRLERLLGQARVKRQVQVAKSCPVGRGQLAGRVLADRLQEPVSRAAIDARFDLEHRFICQLLQAIDHICRR